MTSTTTSPAVNSATQAKVAIAQKVTTIGFHVVRDRLTRPEATASHQVPWSTEAIQHGVAERCSVCLAPGRQGPVHGARVGDIGDDQSAQDQGDLQRRRNRGLVTDPTVQQGDRVAHFSSRPRVVRSGGEAPKFDDAWRIYRQQTLYGLHAWLFTIGRSALQPRMQPDEVSLALIERMSNAAVDNESLAAFDSEVTRDVSGPGIAGAR